MYGDVTRILLRGPVGRGRILDGLFVHIRPLYLRIPQSMPVQYALA